MEEKIPDTTEKTEAKKGSGQFAAAPIILFAISSAHPDRLSLCKMASNET